MNHTKGCNCASCVRMRRIQDTVKEEGLTIKEECPPTVDYSSRGSVLIEDERGMLITSTSIRPKTMPLGSQGAMRILCARMIREHAAYVRRCRQPASTIGYEGIGEHKRMVETSARDLEDWADLLESQQALNLSMLKRRGM